MLAVPDIKGDVFFPNTVNCNACRGVTKIPVIDRELTFSLANGCEGKMVTPNELFNLLA